MNKDKLVALIVKKQTYKDTKQVQNDIVKKKEEAVSVSIGAIQQILKDQYNAQAKLYAIRYLKDCFEKGNPSFIAKTQTKILPLLEQIIRDSNDEHKIVNYAGNSFSKNEDLEKFKSLVSSLFVMSRQCIQNWGTWIPDPRRQFAKVRNRINEEIPFHYGDKFQYFRKQNAIIFKQNCQKNGITIADIPDHSSKRNSNQMQPKQQKIKESKKKSKVKGVNKIQQILIQAEKRVSMEQSITKKQMQSIEEKFNQAFNQYIEQNPKFDEAFVEQSFNKFQSLKKAQKQKNQLKQHKLQQENKQSNLKKQTKKQEKKWSQIKQQKRQEKKTEQKAIKNRSQVKKIESRSNMKKQAKEEQFEFAPQIVHTSNLKNQSISKHSGNDPQKLNVQKTSKNENHQTELKVTPTPQNESRVKFDRSSDEEESQKHVPQNKIQSQIRETATFSNLNDVNKPNKIQQTQFSSEIMRLKEEHGRTTKEKIKLEETVKVLERQIFMLKESQQKMRKQVENTVPQRQFQQVRKQLAQEKKEKIILSRQIQTLKNQLNIFQKKLQQIKSEKPPQIKLQRPVSHHQNHSIDIVPEKQEFRQEQSKLNKSNLKLNQSSRPNSSLRIMKEHYSSRVDEDYISDLTHFDNIQTCLSESNIINLKLGILGLAETFYEGQIVTISKTISHQNAGTLKQTLFFEFRQRQSIFPKTAYKNIQNIDLWTKPLVGKQKKFSQQIVGKICGNPLKLMKASIKSEQFDNISFLLPFTFLDYLKVIDFQEDQFEEIFDVKRQKLQKSKIFKLNSHIISSLSHFQRIFNGAVIRRNKVEFCLSEEPRENTFMIQIEILQNQKAMIRVLPIPFDTGMKLKTKEIIEDMVFLFSS